MYVIVHNIITYSQSIIITKAYIPWLLDYEDNDEFITECIGLPNMHYYCVHCTMSL